MGAKPKRRAGATKVPAIRAAPVHIVHRVPTAKLRGDKDVVLVCPWLEGLPEDSGLWISALPIHDER